MSVDKPRRPAPPLTPAQAAAYVADAYARLTRRVGVVAVSSGEVGRALNHSTRYKTLSLRPVQFSVVIVRPE